MKCKCESTAALVIALITAFFGACMLVTGSLIVDAWAKSLHSCDNDINDPEEGQGKGFRSFGEGDGYHQRRCAKIDCIVAIGSFGILVGLIQLASVICLLYELISQLPRAALFPWILTFDQTKKIWYLFHILIFVICFLELIMSILTFVWTHGTFEIALFSLTLIEILWCGSLGIYLKYLKKKKVLPFKF